MKHATPSYGFFYLHNLNSGEDTDTISKSIIINFDIKLNCFIAVPFLVFVKTNNINLTHRISLKKPHRSICSREILI